jgi:Zn-dependent protease
VLIDPGPTQFDLRFRVFGVPVRVHPLFWVLSAVLGWDLTRAGLPALATWIVCCFLSILLHELGHVWMGQLFGSHGHIVLYSFGGLAIGSNDLPRRWQRFAVSFAGPAIQLVLWAALFAAFLLPWSPFRVTPGWPPLLILGLHLMLLINLAWPLLNLLPVWPLDGGMMTREVCEGISPSRGLVVSLWISLVVAAALAMQALLAYSGRSLDFFPFTYLPRGMFTGVFFALFAADSYQALQAERSRRRYWDDDLPWSR